MGRQKRKRWQFSLRSLFVGVAAAAIAILVMSLLGSSDDLVIIVAAIAAALIEAMLHRRGLRWLLTRRTRGD